MKPDFMDRDARIIEEVRTRTCVVDKIDTEALFEFLQEELIKYRNESPYGHSIGYNVLVTMEVTMKVMQ